MHLFAINAISIVDTTFNLLFFVSFVAIVLYALTKTKLFTDFVVFEKRDRKSILELILVGSVLEILASEFGILLPNGMIAGTRVAIGMIFGVFGGPWVGIPVGAVGGLYRMSGLFWRGLRGGMGYEFAIGGFISAFVAGVLGGVLHLRGVTARTLRKNTRKILLITILWRILVIEVVYPLTAPIFSELTFVESFYISNQSLLVPELISDSFAIIVFSIFLGGIVAEEERETRKLQKLLRRYEELLGPEAQRIARDVEKDFAIERMIEKRPLQSKKKSKDGKSRKGKGQK